MNSELKASLQAVFDLVQLVKSAAAKKTIVELFPGLYKVAQDIPAIIANWPDLLPELQKLSGVDADADLLSFIMSQIPGVTGDAHAQKIITAALDLALSLGQKGYALEQAIAGN